MMDPSNSIRIVGKATTKQVFVNGVEQRGVTRVRVSDLVPHEVQRVEIEYLVLDGDVHVEGEGHEVAEFVVLQDGRRLRVVEDTD